MIIIGVDIPLIYLDRTLNDDIQQMSMYINHPPNDFEVVRSIQQPH